MGRSGIPNERTMLESFTQASTGDMVCAKCVPIDQDICSMLKFGPTVGRSEVAVIRDRSNFSRNLWTTRESQSFNRPKVRASRNIRLINQTGAPERSVRITEDARLRVSDLHLKVVMVRQSRHGSL